MKQITIDNWAVVYDPSTVTPYTPPERIIGRLVGDVESEDGEVKTITTSPITKVQDGLVYTRNSAYHLLNPHADYEEMFPDAKNRALNGKII